MHQLLFLQAFPLLLLPLTTASQLNQVWIHLIMQKQKYTFCMVGNFYGVQIFMDFLSILNCKPNQLYNVVFKYQTACHENIKPQDNLSFQNFKPSKLTTSMVASYSTHITLMVLAINCIKFLSSVTSCVASHMYIRLL